MHASMCGVGATVSSVVSMEAADIGTTNRLVETALTSEAVGRWKDAGVNNRRIAGGALVAGVLLLAALVVGGYVAHKHFMRGVNGDDFAIWDDPKRTFFLPNDTGGPRLMAAASMWTSAGPRTRANLSSRESHSTSSSITTRTGRT